MANPKTVVLDQLQSGQMLIERLTPDLTDQEYFTAPAEGTNHIGWLLGHIAVSEDSISAAITGSPMRIDESMHAVFKGGVQYK